MSAPKRVIAVAVCVVSLLLVSAGIASFIAGIWTGDDRWIQTGAICLPLGVFIAFAGATFPGWDW